MSASMRPKKATLTAEKELMAGQLLNFGMKVKASRRGSASAIAPLFELLSAPPGRRFPHLLPDGHRALKMGDVVAWCAERHNCSGRTIQRQIAYFRANGGTATERGPRADKGSSRFFRRHHNAAAMGAYLSLTWNVSSRAVHKAILRNRELLEVSAKNAPSYETVRNWLRSGDSKKLALALEGQRAYRDIAFWEIESGVLLPAKGRSK